MRSEILLIILGMALVTFFTRCGALILFNFTKIPHWLERWLKYVPIAILTALIIPALLVPQGNLEISIHNHYLIAGVVTAIIAYKTQNILASLSTGMVTMLSLRFFM